jgi:hypothetical protein
MSIAQQAENKSRTLATFALSSANNLLDSSIIDFDVATIVSIIIFVPLCCKISTAAEWRLR